MKGYYTSFSGDLKICNKWTSLQLPEKPDKLVFQPENSYS